MRRHVLSNLDSLDFDARELAKAAARRAGLSLEDWIAMVLEERRERAETPWPQARQHTGDSLDGPNAKVPRDPKPYDMDHEARMAAAAAESERRVHDQTSRTAIALESMATWIEHAEERLNETARTSADQQDRMAQVLSQTLSTLKDRLDAVEHRVASERTAPPRAEFPVQDTVKVLGPLSETLVGLRTDMSRLTERLEQPNPVWEPAVEKIRAEIERLRFSMGGLATREEVAVLARALQSFAKDLEQGRPSKDLLTLAQSIAALYRQVQSLSQDISEGLHQRIGGEIDLLKRKIDKVAEAGVDRSVIDFLSSQIVDMRQDLAHRAEPQQITRLSEDVTALSHQITELRASQVGRSDFTALRTSLENVCSALNRTVAAQEASDVPDRIQSLSERLDILVSRPEPEPANLEPITEQLALLTDRMTGLSADRQQQGDALAEMIDRLSSQLQAVTDKKALSHEPLMERFDRIEQELRQVGQQADNTGVEQMLRSIDEKLDRSPAQASGLDTLEQRIMALADRLAGEQGEPLQKVLDEATAHFKNLQAEASNIAEKAAKTALKDVQSNLPDPGDLNALKQGFVEMKALQNRADKKTQQTLRAVHEALETLVTRFPEHGLATLPGGNVATLMSSGTSPEKLQPADRLEAAVRRLHAAALSQMEEVSATHLADPVPLRDADRSSGMSEASSTASAEEADFGNVRASFIAAARRAAQTASPEKIALDVERLESESTDHDETVNDDVPAPLSFMERLRRTFESHRRPLLFGLAFLILAAGTAQIVSGTYKASAPAKEAAQVQSQDAKSQGTKPQALKVQDPMTSGSIASADANLFQASSLATVEKLVAAPAHPKFMVDPGTVGEIPTEVPSALRQAALSGDAAAIYEIASQAMEGRGLGKDMILAIRLFERAAQAGLPPAQERLAMIHDKGIGVQRDPKLAATWYERAAMGGNIRAMHNLATLLASGISGKPDYTAALRWYGEAAEAGLRDSQFNMGVLLTRGIGTKQDLPKAFKWFSLAAAQGDTDAVKKRDEVAARLGASDLAAAKEALEQWRPRAVDPSANEVASPAAGQTAALDRASNKRI